MEKFSLGNRPPLFFMHIPKTAGSSIRMFLENQYHAEEIYPAEGWGGTLSTAREAGGYRLVRGHFAFNMSQSVPDARILTVLRNPLLRTVSALRHIKRDPQFHALHQVAKDMTLQEMLRSPQIMPAQRDIQTAYLCASVPPENVLEFLGRHPNGDPADLEDMSNLDLAVKRLKQIDFLGVMEDLSTCIDEMSAAMNYHKAVYFPFVNEDPKLSNTLCDLSDEDIAILQNANQLDLQLYDHACALLTQRRFERMMHHLVAEGVYKIPPGSFEIEIGGIIPGSGWSPPEREGAGCWRWTGPDDQFSLEVPLRKDREYNVHLRFNVPRAQTAHELTAEINGVPVQRQVTPSGLTAFHLAFHIDKHTLERCDGFCRIVLGVKTERPPGELRTLGIAVNRITFDCIS